MYNTNYYQKKILLVDDEEEILKLLSIVLTKEGFKNIFQATLGQEALQIASQENPDLIILDIMLPDLDGFSLCQKLREFTYCPIILLTAKDDESDKILGLGLGADDYVTKPFSPKEVAFRVKAQLRRTNYLKEQIKEKEEVIAFSNLVIKVKEGIVEKDGKALALTAKEFQLLVFLAKNSGKVFSKEQICTEVWGDSYFGYDNTIMVHIRKLREKIESDPSKPLIIQTIKGLGYKLNLMGEK